MGKTNPIMYTLSGRKHVVGSMKLLKKRLDGFI